MAADRIGEKRLLQLCVALACLVPISAGLHGVLRGAEFFGATDTDLDSHLRYLSGLLLAIGVLFATSIRNIEHYSSRFRLLTLIVIIGGIGRLWGILNGVIPFTPMLLALIMELVITPLLCLWQQRVARLITS